MIEKHARIFFYILNPVVRAGELGTVQMQNERPVDPFLRLQFLPISPAFAKHIQSRQPRLEDEGGAGEKQGSGILSLTPSPSFVV